MNARIRTKSSPTAALTLLAAMLVFAGTTGAATPSAPSVDGVARDTLLDALAPVLAARGANATINIAAADARRTPAPCALLVGFVPPGARLIGRTMVGIRCADGSTWQTFVSADVHVNAPVWQATRALRAGDTLSGGDVAVGSGPMTSADIDAVTSAAPARNGSASRGLATLDGRTPAPLGRTVQRPVGVGHALIAADIREEGRVGVGETVRVIYVGDGFSVSSEGRTVGAADPGASVQIRLASGSVVSGTLREDHRVELAQ